MLERALCPTLVGRDEQLFVLEDALLSAHRHEIESRERVFYETVVD